MNRRYSIILRMGRSARWVMLVLCLAFLLKNVFGEATAWSLTGFFLTLAVWYWLARKRTRELDAPRSR